MSFKENPAALIPEIIYCDNHLLVLNKPAGLLVQGDQTGDPSLFDFASAYIKERYNKPGKAYIGLVHRLDRPVSGVVVLARTSKAAARLSRQFLEKRTTKIYTALAEGEVPAHGEWIDFISRRGATGHIAPEGEGSRADLRFERLSILEGLSLVSVRLGTGRHHQIRLQFASRGYPLLGDFRYGSVRQFGDKAVALHATTLTLFHPTTGEEMTFRAGFPDFWQGYLPEE